MFGICQHKMYLLLSDLIYQQIYPLFLCVDRPLEAAIAFTTKYPLKHWLNNTVHNNNAPETQRPILSLYYDT